MNEFDLRADVPRGGHARSGGGFYHLSFRSGSRGGGACARSAYAYITRTERYDDPDRDEATYTESDHMPAWAQEEPAEYWDAADVHERANGRLYISADFALPRELDSDQQITLAREFAHELTDEEHLPYTLAVHAGEDDEGHQHNPHAHLMFSERQNDGIERSRDAWFRRANAEHPKHGGAPKSRTFHGADWMEHARERWATLTNATLERCGRTERVDHRSYERQGIDREPGEHYGPSAAHVVGRGGDHDRLEGAATRVEDERALSEIDDQITRLQAARDTIARDGLPDEERTPEPRDYSHSFGGDRGDGEFRER